MLDYQQHDRVARHDAGDDDVSMLLSTRKFCHPTSNGVRVHGSNT